ncbi:hypothetical protein C3Y87_12390 [Carbonactinospora thermoautotrophica]|uniref:Uncharacterized protein n=1 Tax=Carbonactinospora thermoautotrophica TaxID=1469144 RepID=A0A132N3S6_9ACTN|nr:hypothetical protein [Carbonactinospora thermoautotrophica]KWX04687.1 hypothetical protein TH66_05600 [Carbonactinospora thermoautotrophica]KWX06884.1 hypothetical protein TR74_20635 [Carbonactinospora thermoautotrophica]MCX9192197.1 hypothetical protein [Carbonactinospora thermoautotrophica]
MGRAERRRGRVARGERDDFEHTIEVGAIAGIVAAIPAVALLVIAGALGVGAATPMYSVVGIVDPGPLSMALDAISRGRPVPFFQQPFMAGLATCLGLGALCGVGFAFGVRRWNVRDWRALVIGPAHGIVCMALFYLVILFALGRLLDAEWIGLARLVGWPTLITAHALYGLVLGLWPLLRPQDLAPGWTRGRQRILPPRRTPRTTGVQPLQRLPRADETSDPDLPVSGG